MQAITIYAPVVTNRLQYVLQWLFEEQLQVAYRIVQQPAHTEGLDFFITYGAVMPNALCIPDAGLLQQTGTDVIRPAISTWQDIPTLFAADDPHYDIPFDVFSAIFYLLSRYEEYQPFTPDRHGRYPAAESILYKNGWLERPIVDEWVAALRKLLMEKHHFSTPTPAFSFQPTYDIDMAYAYSFKGWQRTIGGIGKDVLSRNFARLTERIKVLREQRPDPYDSFFWLQQLHQTTRYKPIYFVLAAARESDFDKNIPPTHPRMTKLILRLQLEGPVGVHPSYHTDRQNRLLAREKRILEKITGANITISRQHFIKLRLPDTYRQLMAAGITDDYSMGYSTHLGFRAGTGASFLWYDLQQEAATALRIHPFCFMDTTAHFFMKQTTVQAFASLRAMATILQQCNSRLITVFHNFSLGNDSQWKGWSEQYFAFVSAMREKTTA